MPDTQVYGSAQSLRLQQGTPGNPPVTAVGPLCQAKVSVHAPQGIEKDKHHCWDVWGATVGVPLDGGRSVVLVVWTGVPVVAMTQGDAVDEIGGSVVVPVMNEAEFADEVESAEGVAAVEEVKSKVEMAPDDDGDDET